MYNPFIRYSERPLVRTPGVDNLAPVPIFQLPLFSMLGRGGQGIFQPLRFLEPAHLPGQKVLVYAGITGVVNQDQLDLASLSSETDYQDFLNAPAGG